MKLSYISLILVACLSLSSCVGKKKYVQLQNERAQLEQQYNELMSKYNQLESSYASLDDQFKTLGNNYQKQSEEYGAYKKNAQQLAAMSNNELMKLNGELQDKISMLEASNKKVQQLQSAIQQQQKALGDLLGKIQNALVGFTPEELTVHMKNGRVYVSLSEQLLFKSGSAYVDTKGKQALGKVAEVLNKQGDIDIIIEGHTDTVPYKGAAGVDNWDLSVKRSTAVLRILTDDYKVDPNKVTAAGRGEYYPVATNITPQGRAQNRRTEIILTPKLAEIMELLQGTASY
ncbi:MAG: OmpA family protein [Chitinophagales bacterium]|nr:OmpA family protein [Chitinophagales bacterium]